MFTGAVGGKTFQTVAFEWSSIVRRTSRCPVSRSSDLLDTRMLFVSLSLSLSLSLLSLYLYIFVFLFSPFLFLSLSLGLVWLPFYFYRQIRRKFIERHFPRRFLQRKCNRAIKLCFSAARENSQPPLSPAFKLRRSKLPG